MKRDMELVANILLEIEKMPPNNRGDRLRVPGYDDDTISEHIVIMKDAGLIYAWKTDGLPPDGRREMRASRLTWAGHEFLDAVRKGDVWEQLKSKWKDAPYEVVLELAKSYAKKKLGLSD
jgi:hypothetical protein